MADARLNAPDAWLDAPEASPSNGEFCPELASPTGTTVTVSPVILDDDYTDNGSGGVVNVRADDVTIGEISIRRSRFHASHVSGSDSAPT